ncbi:tetratricopeptide repeat protein [Isosphaeraceae bacterium EP7]
MRNHPDDLAYREGLVGSYQRLGNFYRHTFRFDKAAAEYRRALPLAENLVTDQPARPEFRAILAQTFLRLADQLSRLAQFDEAEHALGRWQEIAERLVADFPDVPSYRNQLALGSLQRGSMEAQRGRNGGARAAFERAYEIQKSLVTGYPDLTRYRVSLGWICYSAAVDFATLNGREARDGTRARELALEAVAIEPQEAGYWKGLALAEYSAGDLDAALKAATKSLEIQKSNGYRYHWLILALIHLERGDREQARAWAERLLRDVAPGSWSGGEPDFVRLARESEGRLRALLPPEPRRSEDRPKLE